METEEKLRRWWRSAKVSKFTGDKFSSSAVKLLKDSVSFLMMITWLGYVFSHANNSKE